MPPSIPNIIAFLVLILWLVVIIRLIYKVIKNKYSPVKAVKATVVRKNKIDSFSKYSGNGKREKYAVTFLADGKKLSFYVSEFSYRGFKVNENGTLKYRGDRLIDFS